MAQNISLLGASYPDVPAVNLPKTGGGTAKFTDVTDTTASASDVASGKYFYTASGVKTQGSIGTGSATPPSSISDTGASISASSGSGTLIFQKTVTSTPVVTAGLISSGTSGNTQITLSATATLQGATTYHPSASDQTISKSCWLTGAQTIKAVTTTNLTAANIKSGVTVKVGDSTDDDCVTSVTGTYTGGGATNVAIGTFTTSSASGTQNVTLSYTGSGYPVMVNICVDEGAYNSSGTFYGTVKRYAVACFTANKANNTAPTYATSGANNQAYVIQTYKSSTSTASTLTRGADTAANFFTSTAPSAAGSGCVRMSSKTNLVVYVAANSYGLMPSTVYRYQVVYSS